MNTRPADPLSVRRRLGRAEPAATATFIYRSFLGGSLYSRCRMVPSDSQEFDRRAVPCGALWTSVLSASRLLLEVEASPAALQPTVLDGRVRWLAFPPGARCIP